MVDEADAGARPGSRLEPAAWLALALLSATWAWWAAKEGAYFGVVLLPGAMLLCAGAALLFWFSPRREGHGLSWPVLVSIAALVALAGWSALSALWSPAGDVALLDAQRILTYALCFAVGFKFCTLLGTRLHLALVPLAFAGAFAGAIAVGALIMGDVPRNLLDRRHPRVSARLPKRRGGVLRSRGLSRRRSRVLDCVRLAAAGSRAGHGNALPGPVPARAKSGLGARPARRTGRVLHLLTPPGASAELACPGRFARARDPARDGVPLRRCR